MKTKSLLMVGGAVALILYLRKRAAAQAVPVVVTTPKPTGNYVLV